MTKKQKVRKTITFLSLLAFPITIYYFSPYLIVMGAFESIISGSAIIFSLQFLSGIFLGRYFCSYICPAGAMQDILSDVQPKKAKGGRLNLIKFMIWLPWISLILLTYLKSKPLTVDFGYQTTNYISLMNLQSYFIYVAIITLFTVLSLFFGKRANCHYICWMAPFMILGRKLGLLLRIPAFSLKTEKSKCINCLKCNKICPMSLDVHATLQEENDISLECTLCGECVDVCYSKALQVKYGSKNNTLK